MQASLLSLKRNFGFAELTSARKKPNRYLEPSVLFCGIITMKYKHFFVLLPQNLFFRSLIRNFVT